MGNLFGSQAQEGENIKPVWLLESSLTVKLYRKNQQNFHEKTYLELWDQGTDSQHIGTIRTGYFVIRGVNDTLIILLVIVV